MASYAFEAAEQFDGATTVLPDGRLVNIAERLVNGNGRIETNDETLADALRGHFALKEVDPKASSSSSKSGAKPGGKE